MRQMKYGLHLLFVKLFHIKTYALLILQVYVLYIYVKPVVRYSQAVSYPVTPWLFPFIVSNIYFLFLFMLGIIYYFSDVPFMQYPNMYQVIRTGRRDWALGQITAMFVQSFFFMIFPFAVSALLVSRHCELHADWGKLLHTAALTNAGEYYEFMFSIPYDTMQKFSPLELTALTIGLGGLVIFFVGLLMFAVSLFVGRAIAVALPVAMVTMVFLVEDVHPLLTKSVSMLVPVGWMRTANIGLKVQGSFVMPSIGYMLAGLLIGSVVLCVLIVWKVRHVEFQWNKED